MSGKPRICILTPGALGSNPRVVKEAQALHDAGFDVTVISTRTLAHIDWRDETILAAAQWRSQRLDFRSRDWAWRRRRGLQSARAAGFSMTGWRRLADTGFSPFTAPLLAAAKAEPADLYLAHYPAALPAAALAARFHRARYAFDAEDFHQGDLPDVPAFRPQRRLVHAIEAHYLPGCAYVTAASPAIADAYAASYAIARPAVVLNVFPRGQAPTRATPAGTAEPGPSVYWFSQTIGADRGLESAAQAIGRARTRPHLYLRGSPAAGFTDHLRAAAAACGAGERLHILPPAAPSEMERLAAQYDLGLSGEPGHSRNNRLALGNKLFSYLLAGLPVVMSDIPAHRTFAPEAADAVHLYSIGDADSLAAAFDALLGDPARLAAARAAAFQLGQTRFNWEVEQAKLLDRIGPALAGSAEQANRRDAVRASSLTGVS